MRALNVDRAWSPASAARDGRRFRPPIAKASDPAPPTPEYEAALAEVIAAHGTRRGRRRGPPPLRRGPAHLGSRAGRRPRRGGAGESTGARDRRHGQRHLETATACRYQLAALGMHDVTVLLPWDTDRDCAPSAPTWPTRCSGSGRPPTRPTDRPKLGVTLARAAGGGARVTEVAPEASPPARGCARETSSWRPPARRSPRPPTCAGSSTSRHPAPGSRFASGVTGASGRSSPASGDPREARARSAPARVCSPCVVDGGSPRCSTRSSCASIPPRARFAASIA